MVTYTPPSDTHDLARKLNLIYFSNEFPNDDLSFLLRQLHNHSKRHEHPILARFLREASRALRQEVSQLRAELAHLVPAFESVTSLAGETKLRKGPLCGSVDGVLLCVLQLATYIGLEIYSSFISVIYPPTDIPILAIANAFQKHMPALDVMALLPAWG